MVRDETILLGLGQLIDGGILQTDTRLTITGWNRWLEVHSGRPAAEMLGRNLLEAFPDIAARRLDRFFRQALEGQVGVLAQRIHKYLLLLPPNADGVALPSMQQSVRIAPLIQEGQIVGTLTLIEDVTERVVYDAELAARARQQAAVAALGQQALAGGDLSALLDETAQVPVEVLGMEYCAIWELIPGGQMMRLRAGAGWREGAVGEATADAGPSSLAGHTLRSGGCVLIKDWGTETRFPQPAFFKDHDIVSGLSVPLIGGNRLLGIVGAYTRRRVTFTEDQILFLQAVANVLGLAVERKHLERELQARLEQLADADRRKDEFLAMLAHELRNPLAPIHNAVQFLRLKGPGDPGERDAREVIERQVQQMTRLVDDLLDVSRITRGKVDLQKEPLEIAAVLARAVETSRPLIDSRKHHLRVTIPEESLRVEGDLTRLAQVVANLLNNAAKFTEAGGRIDLVVERTANEAILRIRDTGVGLAPEALSTIFDLFTQVQGSVSRSEGGLGIGLSLVRGLVEMHGGRVTAHSEGPGRGSEFVVHLPLMAQWPAACAGEAKKAGVWEVPPRRILVVDDNVDSADSLALLLRVIGHEVRTANDGLQALEVARTHPPDVVLLDIGLPHLDGLQVASRMRQELGLKSALLIALTGYGQDEDRRRSWAAGFDAHLIKPVDLDALQALLAKPPDSR